MTELKKRRKLLGISQIELAGLVGVSIVTIQLWERGAGSAKKENGEKLEEVLRRLEGERDREIEELREKREN